MSRQFWPIQQTSIFSWWMFEHGRSLMPDTSLVRRMFQWMSYVLVSKTYLLIERLASIAKLGNVVAWRPEFYDTRDSWHQTSAAATRRTNSIAGRPRHVLDLNVIFMIAARWRQRPLGRDPSPKETSYKSRKNGGHARRQCHGSSAVTWIQDKNESKVEHRKAESQSQDG